MLKFFKNNGHLIWRLILNQIGLTVFGLMTTMAAAAVDRSLSGEGELQRTCMIWTSVFAILFYMFIDYTAIKEEGQRDKIRSDAGRIERDPWRGFKIAIIAALPNLILGVIAVGGGILGAESGLALGWAGAASGTSKLISLIIQAMYWGVLLGLPGVVTVGDTPALAYLLIPLPALICASVAYIAGLHEVSLMRHVKSFFTPEGQ